MLRSVTLLGLSLICNLCAASDLSGFWRHPKDPVWLDVDADLCIGIVIRNDNDPSSVGFTLLKELVADAKQGQWLGRVYVPQLNDYKHVEITLPDANTLKMKVKIGLINHTLEWTKVSSTPKLGMTR